MQEIRLPRALLGVMIGATLGLTGAALQGYLRNPLADPGVLGISASASLGAVIAIYTGLSSVFQLALPAFAIAGAARQTSMSRHRAVLNDLFDRARQAVLRATRGYARPWAAPGIASAIR